jgi:hypothetical protein
VFVRRAFAHHGNRCSFIGVVIVLVGADVYAIARLKIADVRLAARNSEVFSRISDRDGRKQLVVVFDHNSLVPDVSQCPDQRRRVGLTPLLRSALLRIPLAWISTARISPAHAGYADHDLAKTGKAGQKGKYQ